MVICALGWMLLKPRAITLAMFWYLYAGAKLRGSSQSRCSCSAERQSKDVSVKCTKGYDGWICGADLLPTMYVVTHQAMTATVNCHHIITFEDAHSKFHLQISVSSFDHIILAGPLSCKMYALTY